MAVTKTEDQKIPTGTWQRLPTEEVEKKPKVTFDVNITQSVVFLENDPKEYQGDTGAYYVFNVEHNKEQKVIMTSAWSLLRALKTHMPLRGKAFEITKKLEKGKQFFVVKQIESESKFMPKGNFKFN